jgi:hypothetical protein
MVKTAFTVQYFNTVLLLPFNTGTRNNMTIETAE